MRKSYTTALYFLGVGFVAAGFALLINLGAGLIAFGAGVILYSSIRAIMD